MNTKSVGNIGEAKVLSKFVELNIPVFLPFGDNEKYDLVAEFNGKLNKIQIKTCKKAEQGRMMFDLVSSTTHRKNGVQYIYTKSDIDYFALYNLERDVVMLVKVEDAPKRVITIRYKKTLNGQSKGLRWEENYLLKNVI